MMTYQAFYHYMYEKWKKKYKKHLDHIFRFACNNHFVTVEFEIYDTTKGFETEYILDLLNLKNYL
jgi:hypothetical protein